AWLGPTAGTCGGAGRLYVVSGGPWSPDGTVGSRGRLWAPLWSFQGVEGLVVPVDELGVAEDPAEPATGAWEQSTAHAEAVSVGDGALLEEGRPQALLGDRAAPADPKGLR